VATKRIRGNGTVEVVWKEKGELPGPVSYTFPNEAEADAAIYECAARRKRGERFPDDFYTVRAARRPQTVVQVRTLADVIRDYQSVQVAAPSDTSLLELLIVRKGKTPLHEVTYGWAESWVTDMKRVEHLAPTTIRHYVGALARALDWAARRQDGSMPQGNPLRLFPRRYALYTDQDAKAAGRKIVDIERGRRLEPDEEKAIRAIVAGEKPSGRQRALDLRYQAAIECLFELALESAMRMREMFTLEMAQINFPQRTIFLTKTKNGDSRQVPMKNSAITSLKRYLSSIKEQERGMMSFTGKPRLFPWWDGNQTERSLKAATSLISRQFARIFDAAGCPDYHFHDLRHEATCRFYQTSSLTDLEISLITGHKDLRMLRRYANLRGSHLASRIG